MSHRDLALDFLRRFAGGDVDGLEPLLAEDLRLNGPNLELESRTAYLEALRPPPPEACKVRALSVTDDGDTVTVSYEHEKRGTRRIPGDLRFK
jgi:hypothetical protein